jgi:hypothetical protein
MYIYVCIHIYSYINLMYPPITFTVEDQEDIYIDSIGKYICIYIYVCVYLYI